MSRLIPWLRLFPLQFLMSRRLIRLKKRFEPPQMTLMPRTKIPEDRVSAFCDKHGLRDLARRVKVQIAKAESTRSAREEAAFEIGGGAGRW